MLSEATVNFEVEIPIYHVISREESRARAEKIRTDSICKRSTSQANQTFLLAFLYASSLMKIIGESHWLPVDEEKNENLVRSSLLMANEVGVSEKQNSAVTHKQDSTKRTAPAGCLPL